MNRKGFAPVLMVVLIMAAVVVLIVLHQVTSNRFVSKLYSFPIITEQKPSQPIIAQTQILPYLPLPDTSVKIDTEEDNVLRQQKLIQRLDQEISQSNYTVLEGTNLELKVPQSYSIPTEINSATSADKNLLTLTDKESDLFWKVLNCDYEYNRVPTVRKTLNESFCKDLLSYFSQKQLDSYQNRQIKHNFFVSVIKTTKSPQEWVLDNVSYQRTKLRDQPEEASRGVIHTSNGFSFLAISVACCGGYEMNYFTQYQDFQGNRILLKFGTNDIDGKTTTDGNLVLDKILATLKRE